jgi:valyl-tRNA synthetase
MDTWATSSVSPQINSHWQLDEKRHNSLFPADLRPQAHEIIRTWAFYTITKAWMHEGKVPWKNIAISGWVVDPNREKMSKSKGNVVTPQALIENYSADGIRYWAGRAKLGQDTIYDESVFGTGKRLGNKIFNASRFVMMQLGDETQATLADITVPIDRAWIEVMRGLIETSTKNFEKYDYAQALIETEQRFWDFCDNYLEIVKARAYQKRDQAEGRSAIATLEWTLKTFLRLMAPFLPYVCDEVWSWRFKSEGRDSSVHTTKWPSVSEVSAVKGDASVYELSSLVINKIRAAKSSQQKSLKWPVARLAVAGTSAHLSQLEAVRSDLLEAGLVQKLETSTAGEELKVDVELATSAE